MTEKLSGFVCDVCRIYVNYLSEKIKDWIIEDGVELFDKHHFCSKKCRDFAHTIIGELPK